MNNVILSNVLRFLGLYLAQALVFKQASSAIGTYFHIIAYPIFVLLLPVMIPTSAAILLGVLMGVMVDFAYDTPGVHTSASAFSAFCRPLILAIFEPKGGFAGKDPVPSPHHIGWQTFLQVAAVYFFAHLFWYFSVSEFTFVYLGSISLKTIIALAVSMVLTGIYMSLFRTK
jgi:hypothetical protein